MGGGRGLCGSARWVWCGEAMARSERARGPNWLRLLRRVYLKWGALTGSCLKKMREIRVRRNQRRFHDFHPRPAHRQ